MSTADDQGAAGIRLGTRASTGLLAAVVLGAGIAFLDSTVVNVALPTIGRDLDASFAQLQWIVTGYTLTLASFILVGGSMADRLGRRRVYRWGILGFAATSLLCAVAPTADLLILARALQGVAGALLTPGSLAIIQASFHPDDRGRAIGTWAGLTGLTPALGPLLGGWLTQVDWRLVFLINLPIAAAAAWLTTRHVPESRDPQAAGRLDWVGAALAIICLGGATYALIGLGADPQAATAVAAAWAVPLAGALGILGAAGFLWWERRAPNPMVPLSLFANRTFSVTNALTLVVYAALGAFLFFVVLQLQTTLGYSPLASGLATLPITVLLLLFSARAGDLAGRVGPRIPLTVGPLVAAAGTTWLAFLDAGAPYVSGVLPGVLLFGTGLVLLVAPLTTTVLAAAPDRLAGTASGVNNAVSRGGGLLAVAAIPTAVGLAAQDYADPAALTSGYQSAMLVCAGLLVLGGLSGLLVPARLEEGR